MMEIDSTENLLSKIEELESRLAEYEQLVDAIKAGEVDAFALTKDNQSEIFTLQSGDYAYRLLVENLNEGALNLSEDGLIVYTNSYFHKLLNLPYEKVIGKSIFQFIETSSAETFNTLFKEGCEGQCKGEINLQVDNKIVPVYISLTSLHPTLPAIGMIVTDLTEKKRSENELESKNRFIEAIIESSHELIAVYDKDCRLLTVNKATEEFVGMSREKMIGKKLIEIYPGTSGTKSENDLLKALQGAFVKNEPYQSNINGRYIQNYLTPLKDENGNIYAALAIAHDVTEIKKAEKELKQSQEHFSKLFSVSPVALSLSGAADGTVMDVNEAWVKMFGVSRSYITGKTVRELNFADIRESNQKIRAMLQNNGSVHGMEMKFKMPEGNTVVAFLSIETIELNQIKCFLVAYFDLSERIKAEKAIKNANEQLQQKNIELEKSNNELASFNYVASHDLQEPLRKIQTFCDILNKTEFNVLSEHGKSTFSRMRNAANRMQMLIDDLLSYSRTNTADRRFEKIQLDKIIEEVKEDLKEEIHQKNATIEITSSCELNIIQFQFRQLLYNLLSNSLKFSDNTRLPHIQIKSEMVEGSKLPDDHRITEKIYCHLSVTDNGIGFEPQYGKKIFELFQRLHGRREYTGTGIGLAIVKRIVENHNGFITATGELHKGAQFDIFIPVNNLSNLTADI